MRGKVSICAVLVLVAAGCGSGATTFKAAPQTPTDVREVAQIEHALNVYERTSRVIRANLADCVKRLPPGFPPSSCRQDVEALSTQRARQLRGPLGALAQRLGPVCGPLVRRTLNVPPASAGPPLAAAARACRAEYERASARP